MASTIVNPIQLRPIFRERVWGRRNLAPLFPDAPSVQPIGEVWFTHEDNLTSSEKSLGALLTEHPEILGSAVDPRHPGICPLLVKLLFTTERLSVQVHPDDEYAAKHHQSLGKTEAWYVLDSQPPGEVAVGFKENLTPDSLEQSAKSGEIEQLLDWRKVKEGDVVYTPAGTVHAIGAGLTICEIQENSDITYRLYDYGRPRELHLDHGVRVSHLGPHTHETTTTHLAPWRDHLAESPYFHIERLRPTAKLAIGSGSPYYLLFICTKGTGTIGGKAFEPGTVWLIPAGNDEALLDGAGSEWILTYSADAPTNSLSEPG